MGNPWLIKQCVEYIEKGIEPERITIDEKVEMFKMHADLITKRQKGKIAITKMRTHAAYYLKNSYRSMNVKKQIFKMNSKEELFDLIDEYVKSIER